MVQQPPNLPGTFFWVGRRGSVKNSVILLLWEARIDGEFVRENHRWTGVFSEVNWTDVG
ncbi:hypothetical protein FE257_010215, partial [Aspergillus nanangensis]